MDNIIVINLKALAGRMLKCRLSWPRAKNVESAGHLLKLSSQLVTRINVETAGHELK